MVAKGPAATERAAAATPGADRPGALEQVGDFASAAADGAARFLQKFIEEAGRPA